MSSRTHIVVRRRRLNLLAPAHPRDVFVMSRDISHQRPQLVSAIGMIHIVPHETIVYVNVGVACSPSDTSNRYVLEIRIKYF